MKKMLLSALVAAVAIVASAADVYKVTTVLKVPVYIGNSWTYSTKKYIGTMTLDQGSGTLELGDVVYSLSDGSMAITTGRSDSVAGVKLEFVSADGDSLTLCGAGKIYSKIGKPSPCSISEACRKIYFVRGRVTGLFDCGCAASQHKEIELGGCEVSEEPTTTLAPVFGTWRIALVSVDDSKFESWKKTK